MCSICTFPRCIIGDSRNQEEEPKSRKYKPLAWREIYRTFEFQHVHRGRLSGASICSMAALTRPGLDLGLSRTVDSLPVRILTLELYHEVQRTKVDQIRADDFEVHFSFNPSMFYIPGSASQSG